MNKSASITRRFPIGAELIDGAHVSFRIWAPKAKRLDVVIETDAPPTFHPLEAESGGYFSGVIAARAGDLYRFRLNEAKDFYPDPVSRSQPRGPHGPSSVIDSSCFKWSNEKWKGLPLRGQIIYEMHVATFTPEGTWRAAMQQLAELARIGISVIEMMPIADFAGEFGWGYDGVNLFAPTRLYGEPDDLRAFIDAAHGHGLAVILDVVYNHFGPAGNYLSVFSDHYMTKRHENDWGDSINFDDPDSGPVREFFISNARYWIEEFRFDGFRFDATQNIIDQSGEYILGAITSAAREAARGRTLILLAENEPQESKLVRPKREGGDGLDGLWNDDWHHSAMVALTGNNEAYYTDYRGAPQEFISAAKYGYLFQGQPYQWQDAPRGTPTTGISPEAFVIFLENHDQVSNSATGARLRFLTSPGKYRAMTALLLLAPSTPLLFQGQEFGASSPFVYFCDVGKDLREAIRQGRFEFLAQFPSMATEEVKAELQEPSDPNAFARCKLDFSERETNRALYDLHCDLLRLRRKDARFGEQRSHGLDGAVLTAESFVLRFFGEDGDDRLLVINLGKRHKLERASEPLLAPPLGCEWKTLWSSDALRYGGPGAVAIVSDRRWILPAESATVLQPIGETQSRRKPERRRGQATIDQV